MKKSGVIGKGGGVVSGGGHGSPAGTNHAREKICGLALEMVVLPEGLEWVLHAQVTFLAASLIRMIQNGSNFFLLIASCFSSNGSSDASHGEGGKSERRSWRGIC